MSIRHLIQVLWLILLSFGIHGAATAQGSQSAASFDRLYGRTDVISWGKAVAQTADGGYIVAGVEIVGESRIVVLKTDARGRMVWQRALSIAEPLNEAYLIRETATGYLLVAGAFVGGRSSQIMVFSLDPSGMPRWQRTYAWGLAAHPLSIAPTIDGGYLLGAFVDNGPPGTVAPPWALKLDADGDILWQQMFDLIPGSIHATGDGGVVVAGTYRCAPTCAGSIAKLDSNGALLWSRRITLGPGDTKLNTARPTPEGGYLLAGSYSTTIDDGKAWLMTLDADGGLVSLHTLVGNGCGSASALEAFPQGGGSALARFSTHCPDPLIARIEGDGTVAWQVAPRRSDGRNDLLLDDVAPTGDAGFVATGYTTLLLSPSRLFVLKADAGGVVDSCAALELTTTALAVGAPLPATVEAAAVSAFGTSIAPTTSVYTVQTLAFQQRSGCGR